MKSFFILYAFVLTFITNSVAQSSYEFTTTTKSSIDDILYERFGADTTCVVFYTYTEASNETTSCWSQGLQEQYQMFLEDVQLPSNYRMRVIYPAHNGLHVKYKLHDNTDYYVFVRRMYLTLQPMLNEVRF